MSDSATDPAPPSAATLAVALGRGNETGLLAAYDAYGADLFAYAEFLLAGHHSEADRADQAAGAVLDALLAATGAIGDLTDPDRIFPWLLALTRNECLRRGYSMVFTPQSYNFPHRAPIGVQQESNDECPSGA